MSSSSSIMCACCRDIEEFAAREQYYGGQSIENVTSSGALPLTVRGSSFWTWSSHFGGAGERY
jgi:hypothetical protein